MHRTPRAIGIARPYLVEDGAVIGQALARRARVQRREIERHPKRRLDGGAEGDQKVIAGRGQDAAVEAQIRAVTGLELVVNGKIDVSVFPGSYVSFHDVGLKGGGAGEPALSVDVLTANLRLLPLLLRRFEIADVMMLRPHIRVIRAADGISNWTPFIDTLTRTVRIAAAPMRSS